MNSKQEAEQLAANGESNNNNEIYHMVTEKWPNDAYYKSYLNSQSITSLTNSDGSKTSSGKSRVDRSHSFTARDSNKLEREYDHNGPALTALVSFPGSGNTWLRYLLQQATGKQLR